MKITFVLLYVFYALAELTENDKENNTEVKLNPNLSVEILWKVEAEKGTSSEDLKEVCDKVIDDLKQKFDAIVENHRRAVAEENAKDEEKNNEDEKVTEDKTK